jgi:hypothetical protein
MSVQNAFYSYWNPKLVYGFEMNSVRVQQLDV